LASAWALFLAIAGASCSRVSVAQALSSSSSDVHLPMMRVEIFLISRCSCSTDKEWIFGGLFYENSPVMGAAKIIASGYLILCGGRRIDQNF
jgi:hypothetical protein